MFKIKNRKLNEDIKLVLAMPGRSVYSNAQFKITMKKRNLCHDLR